MSHPVSQLHSSNPALDRLERLVAEVGDLQSKLILLAGNGGKTKLLRSLQLTCTGFEFCPEVTAKLGRRNIKIVEVPIAYSARAIADGKKVRWTDGVEAMWVLLRNRLGKNQ